MKLQKVHTNNVRRTKYTQNVNKERESAFGRVMYYKSQPIEQYIYHRRYVPPLCMRQFLK